MCSTWKQFYNSAVICVSEQNKTIKYIIKKQLTYFSYNLCGWMLRVNLSIVCLLAFILAWDWMWSEPCVNCKCFWLSQCCHSGKVKLQLFFYNDWTVSWGFQLIVLAIFLSLICSVNLSLSFFLSIYSDSACLPLHLPILHVAMWRLWSTALSFSRLICHSETFFYHFYLF